MKHSELRHQPRHVNPRIQDLRIKTMRNRVVAVSSRAKEKVRERPIYKASQTCGYYSNSILATIYCV